MDLTAQANHSRDRTAPLTSKVATNLDSTPILETREVLLEEVEEEATITNLLLRITARWWR